LFHDNRTKLKTTFSLLGHTCLAQATNIDRFKVQQFESPSNEAVFYLGLGYKFHIIVINLKTEDSRRSTASRYMSTKMSTNGFEPIYAQQSEMYPRIQVAGKLLTQADVKSHL